MLDAIQIALGFLFGAVFLFGPLLALVDIVAVDQRRFRAVNKDKTAWMLVVFFGWWVGAVIYWVTVRPEVRGGSHQSGWFTRTGPSERA